MKINLLYIIALFISISTTAQELLNEEINRNQLLNFALLLKNKEDKSVKDKIMLAELYDKLGYKKLAAINFEEAGNMERNELDKRKYTKLADSLHHVPYKRLYANSFLYKQAPDLVVEQWLSEQPAIDGKFILVDFWATWCGPCKKAIPELNEIHKTFKEKLVVIGISDEQAIKVERFTYPPIAYYKAIDTQKRMFSQLQIRGIPHVILISPKGKVIWEGFPFDNKDPLTKEKVEELIKIFE